MSHSASLCYWCSKPLSILIKLAEEDQAYVEKIKIIVDNFDLSPRIRQLLKLNNQFTKLPLPMDIWKKTDK